MSRTRTSALCAGLKNVFPLKRRSRVIFINPRHDSPPLAWSARKALARVAACIPPRHARHSWGLRPRPRRLPPMPPGRLRRAQPRREDQPRLMHRHQLLVRQHDCGRFGVLAGAEGVKRLGLLTRCSSSESPCQLAENSTHAGASKRTNGAALSSAMLSASHRRKGGYGAAP